MVTTENIIYELHFKNFISCRSYIPFLRYANFGIVNHSMNLNSSDVIINISAPVRVCFSLYF